MQGRGGILSILYEFCVFSASSVAFLSTNPGKYGNMYQDKNIVLLSYATMTRPWLSTHSTRCSLREEITTTPGSARVYSQRASPTRRTVDCTLSPLRHPNITIFSLKKINNSPRPSCFNYLKKKTDAIDFGTRGEVPSGLRLLDTAKSRRTYTTVQTAIQPGSRAPVPWFRCWQMFVLNTMYETNVPIDQNMLVHQQREIKFVLAKSEYVGTLDNPISLLGFISF